MRLLDLSGKTFGELTVLARAPNKGKRVAWSCKCSCGRMHIVDAGSLVSGSTKSCGHTVYKQKRELQGLFAKGAKPPVEYWVRANMMRRCLDSRHPQYKDYGGRGISVCEDWRNSFEKFYTDLGPRPTPKHTIERKDNKLGYSKENCYWATYTQQVLNRRPVCKPESTGVTGVRKVRGKYQPRIKVAYKEIYLGLFNSLEEAIKARIFAVKKFRGLHDKNI